MLLYTSVGIMVQLKYMLVQLGFNRHNTVTISPSAFIDTCTRTELSKTTVIVVKFNNFCMCYWLTFNMSAQTLLPSSAPMNSKHASVWMSVWIPSVTFDWSQDIYTPRQISRLPNESNRCDISRRIISCQVLFFFFNKEYCSLLSHVLAMTVSYHVTLHRLN